MEQMIETTLHALEKNGFGAHYFATRQEAAQWLTGQFEPEQTVSFGGSVTLEQLGLRGMLEDKGVHYLDYRQSSDPQETKRLSREVFFCDAYLSSANAITEDGFLLNVDGKGNRVAATIFGPDTVYIVAGKNKICPDLSAAYQRLETVAAPLNSRRLDRKTPCVVSGTCQDCHAAERICRVYTVMKRQPFGTKVVVVLIGEDLGY